MAQPMKQYNSVELSNTDDKLNDNKNDKDNLINKIVDIDPSDNELDLGYAYGKVNAITGNVEYYTKPNKHFLYYCRIVWCFFMLLIIASLFIAGMVSSYAYFIVASPLCVILTLQCLLWMSNYEKNKSRCAYYTLQPMGELTCPTWSKYFLMFGCCVYSSSDNDITCFDVFKTCCCCLPSYYTHGSLRIHKNHV